MRGALKRLPSSVPNLGTHPPHPRCAHKQSRRTGHIPKLIHLQEHIRTQRDTPTNVLAQGISSVRTLSNVGSQTVTSPQITNTRSWTQEDPGAQVPKYTTRHTRAAWSPLAGGNAAFSRLGALRCLPTPTPKRPNVSLCLCAHCSTLVSLATPNIHFHTVHPSRRSLRRIPTTNAAHIIHVHPRYTLNCLWPLALRSADSQGTVGMHAHRTAPAPAGRRGTSQACPWALESDS